MTGATLKQQAAAIGRSRKTIQGLSVAATFLLGIRHILPGEAGGGAFDSFCAFGGVETFFRYLLSGQTLKTNSPLNFAVLLGVLGVGLVAGRAFCGWLCPLGAVQDFIAGWARRLSGDAHPVRGKKSSARFPLQLPDRMDRQLRKVKYWLLGLLLFGSLFTVFPPLHNICPVLAIFSFKLTPVLWVVLIAFAGFSLLVERGPCRYLCPLGALLAGFNKISPVRIAVESNCNHCGRCDAECSMGIKAVPENLRDPECVRCLECVATCARKDTLNLKVG